MESSSQTTAQPAYPVRFSVEYPDRALKRLTTVFRLIVAIPILIVAATLGGQDGTYAAGEQGWRIAGGTAGLLFLGPLLMILFRQKYPRWWFDWNLELLRFSNRIGVYLALMDDRYPSTDEQQGVALDFPYPDAKQGADGSGTRQITSNSFADAGASFSPDGTKLAFRSVRNGNIDVYVINVDGTGEQRLTDDPAPDRIADWSPDGTKISFTSDRSGVCAVYTMSPNGSNVQKLTPDSMRAGVAAWSPDGSRLIFSDNFCATTEADLFVMNADGSGVLQVTNSPENELSKSWSPSGDKVVADFAVLTGNALHRGDIAVVTVADGATTNLTNTSGIHEEHPEWSSH
jgi:WD40 repeat protein